MTPENPNPMLANATWPAARLGEALAALARRSGQVVRHHEVVNAALVPGGAAEHDIGGWLEATAVWLGLEAVSVESSYGEVDQMLSAAAPALVRLPGGGAPRFVAILAGKRRRLVLLAPDLEQVRVPTELLRAELCREAEATRAGDVEQVLAAAHVSGRRHAAARQALFRELLITERVGGCWLIRSAANDTLALQAREARLPRWLLALVAAQACQSALWIGSWWLVGWLSLRGRLDAGSLAAWLLLLLTIIPFQLLATWTGGMFALRAGVLLKRRLLFGALRLEPDEIRHQGAGQLLGRVIESESVESLAVMGGFQGLTAMVELLFAFIVLGFGAGSWLHFVLLLGTTAFTFHLARRYWRQKRDWTAQRLAMTHGLVERMVGHRTRLAQEPREKWNAGEDEDLERYLGASRQLDRTAMFLQVLAPRGWFLVGLLGLAPAFLTGTQSTTALAVGVGGVVLAYRALRDLADGLERLAAAGIAWEQIKLFWQAAARAEPVGHPSVVATPSIARGSSAAEVPAPATLLARDLVFAYPDRGLPVLAGASLEIRAGERLLLEGSSGGGKSTLAALLAGCRTPQSGLVLLHGFDRETLGAEPWRRQVVIAPQFHENHVLMGTLAFNLLMGRDWPPSQADVDAAEQVCRGLDLGPLLDRMPGGMQQMVGETGWQLSHGEKSRLYIARALLQRAEVVILDESFAALDPETLARTLRFVLEKAPAVLVIAHP